MFLMRTGECSDTVELNAELLNTTGTLLRHTEISDCTLPSGVGNLLLFIILRHPLTPRAHVFDLLKILINAGSFESKEKALKHYRVLIYSMNLSPKQMIGPRESSEVICSVLVRLVLAEICPWKRP
jgi:hypothetical protein